VAVKIRLKRFGKIRSPHYRIVVADSRTKRDGRAIEEIGKYHPKNDPSLIEVDSERAQYWLSVGAQPTEAVIALFKRTGDWQKYSGDASPSGVTPQPEKQNKTEAFNAALADAGQEPRAAAAGTAKKSASKRASSKAEETSVEGTSEEAQQAAEAGVADALEHLIRGIVSHPDDVTVKDKELRRGRMLEVRVNPDDVGKVIGRLGRTATALRTVVGALAGSQDVRIDFVDVDKGTRRGTGGRRR
jgi:small subunit ribosomal protein S16